MNSSVSTAEDPSSSRDEVSGSRSRMLAGALLVILAVGVISLIATGLRLIHSDADISVPESAVLRAGDLWHTTGHVYSLPEQPPYRPQAFGPLTYLSVSVVDKVVAHDPLRLRLACRWFVFSIYLGTCLLVLIAAKRRAGAAAAGIVALCFAGNPIFSPVFVAVRPDIPALFLIAAAAFVLVRAEEPGLKTFVASGIFTAAALLFKPSFLGLGIAVFCWTASNRRFKQLSAYVLSLLLPVVGIFLVLQLRGDPAIKNFIEVRHTVPGFLTGAWETGSVLLYPAFGIILCGAVFALFGGGKTRDSNFLKIFFVASWACALLFVLFNAGAAVNSFLEAALATALLAAEGLRASSGLRLNESGRSWILVFSIFLALEQLPLDRNLRREVPPAPPIDAAALRDFSIFSSEAHFSYYSRTPIFLDSFTSSMYAMTHSISLKPVLDQITEQKFDVAILAVDRNGRPAIFRGVPVVSPEVIAAVARSYRPLCRAREVEVLVPNNRPSLFTMSAAEKIFQGRCSPEAGSAK